MTTGRINQVAADTGPIDARGPRPGRTEPRKRGRAAVAGPQRVAQHFRKSANPDGAGLPLQQKGFRKLFGTTAPRRNAREGHVAPPGPAAGLSCTSTRRPF